MGAATFDERVGFSHRTGQITHHVDPNIDAERELLFHDLDQTHDLQRTDIEDNFHTVREGRNGGGDAWRTDGRLFMGIVRAKPASSGVPAP